jgi:N-acetylglucosaminyl-diphospho-decaprenol L-rhamnosyltransferase
MLETKAEPTTDGERRSSPASPGRPDLSVVVVSYNSSAELGPCLESVQAASDGLDVELFVVDNASSDGSAELVAERFPLVTVIANRENVGFGQANNRAFARARGRYLLVLNPDTAVEPDALRELVKLADAHPNIGAIGPRLEYPDGSFQHSAFKFPDLRQAFFGFFDVIPIDSPLNGRFPPERYRRPFRAEHLLGACLMLRREALDQVGWFDRRYFMYFEETDLCARLHAAGWLCLYTPSARVTHIQGAATSADPERMSVEFHRSQARFYRRHRGLIGYALLKMIVWPGVGYRLARSVRAYLRGRIDRPLLLTRLGGYWKILWF